MTHQEYIYSNFCVFLNGKTLTFVKNMKSSINQNIKSISLEIKR